MEFSHACKPQIIDSYLLLLAAKVVICQIWSILAYLRYFGCFLICANFVVFSINQFNLFEAPSPETKTHVITSEKKAQIQESNTLTLENKTLCARKAKNCRLTRTLRNL